MKKIITIGVLISMTLLTAACSHQNPMMAMPREDVGKFLATASYKAELALHVPQPQGRVYAKCLFHDKTAGVDCNALYRNMLSYAQTQPQFQTITLTDLIDLKNFYRAKEDYQAAIFDAVPEMSA